MVERNSVMQSVEKYPTREETINALRDNVQETILLVMSWNDITREDLAQKLGVPKSDVADMLEMQDWNPTLMTIAKVFHCLNCTVGVCFNQNEPITVQSHGGPRFSPPEN